MNQTDKSKIILDRLDFLSKTFNAKVNLNPFQQMLRESLDIKEGDIIIGYISTLLYCLGYSRQAANLIIDECSVSGYSDLMVMLRRLGPKL